MLLFVKQNQQKHKNITVEYLENIFDNLFHQFHVIQNLFIES